MIFKHFTNFPKWAYFRFLARKFKYLKSRTYLILALKIQIKHFVFVDKFCKDFLYKDKGNWPVIRADSWIVHAFFATAKSAKSKQLHQRHGSEKNLAALHIFFLEYKMRPFLSCFIAFLSQIERRLASRKISNKKPAHPPLLHLRQVENKAWLQKSQDVFSISANMGDKVKKNKTENGKNWLFLYAQNFWA